jgi:hypothetical protein
MYKKVPLGIFSTLTLTGLTLVFLLFSLSASALAFVYPLEIEGRESTVWLAALALKAGVNIYDQSQVVFVNLNHGPFDPLLKSLIAITFPFLESWQVTRFPVLILPYLFLLMGWKMAGRPPGGSFLHALFLGSVGYLFLVVSAKEFIFVGRSDSTVAVLFLVLLCICALLAPKTPSVAALQGILAGLFGTLVMLTNWRTTPTAVGILVFALWQQGARLMGVYGTSCAAASLITFGLMLYHVSNLNLGVFYQYFFGFYSNAAGWATGESYNGPVLTFVLSLFNPTTSPTALKGGPLILTLIVTALVLKGTGPVSRVNKAWLVLTMFSFIFCAIAYYLNYWGGGSWYFIPFLLILWFFLGSNYSRLSQASLNVLGIIVFALLSVNFRTVIAPTISRASTLRKAASFMADVRSLQEKGSVLSEDTFFYRTRYAGELIDMGDTVSVFAKNDYFSTDFRQTAQRHFDQLRNHPPDYIITVFRSSPELRTLIDQRYTLVASGPANLTANGRGESKLFMRNDLKSGCRLPPGSFSDRVVPADHGLANGSRILCNLTRLRLKPDRTC